MSFSSEVYRYTSLSDANSMREGYRYTPLAGDNSIRLLELLPGEHIDEVFINLITATLTEEDNSYEALSYTWNSLNLTSRVICNGKILLVTNSLETALVHLRHPSNPRRLWVDAICVDQSDLAERSRQVASMSLIYSKAEQVVVWLGEAADDSDLLMDLLAGIANVDVAFYVDESLKWHNEPRTELPQRAFPLSTQDGRIINALRHFFSRSWFRRVWVRQEVALGSAVAVVCGSQIVSWNRIVAFSWAYIRNAEASRSYPFAFSTLAHSSIFCVVQIQDDGHLYHNQPASLDLFNCINATRVCHATDPRDKVFGLLSFDRKRSAKRSFSPDYTVSVEDLYRDISKAWLHEGDAKSLKMVGRHWHKLPGLPSWTTD